MRHQFEANILSCGYTVDAFLVDDNRWSVELTDIAGDRYHLNLELPADADPEQIRSLAEAHIEDYAKRKLFEEAKSPTWRGPLWGEILYEKGRPFAIVFTDEGRLKIGAEEAHRELGEFLEVGVPVDVDDCDVYAPTPLQCLRYLATGE